jgi:hypothetical protein
VSLILGIVAVAGLVFIASLGWSVASVVDWRLLPTIYKARRELRRIAQRRFPSVTVKTFGATNVDPKHLTVIVATVSDDERDKLKEAPGLDSELREALFRVGYPAAAVPAVRFVIESREALNRDFGGSWYQAMK